MLIARTALRASTGPLQDNPLRHPARHVPRTRTRLLRAGLEPHALAMQATVATPAQEYAQRVLQASTNQQEAMVVIARSANSELTRATQVSLERFSCSFPLEPRGSVLL